MEVRSLGRELTDEVVTLRSPLPGDAVVLVAGRDAEFQRFLGDGSPEPAPVAVVLDGARQIVGWIDYDVDRAWLADGEVNVGYHVFVEHRRRGLARRSIELLVAFLEEDDEFRAATVLIDPSNAPSIALAERAGFDRCDDVGDQRLYRRPANPGDGRPGAEDHLRAGRRREAAGEEPTPSGLPAGGSGRRGEAAARARGLTPRRRSR